MRATRSHSRPCVLTLADRFLPGFKAGGPIRSLANLVDQLGDEFRFRIITRDRDAGDSAPYPGIEVDCWQSVGNADVFYLSPPHYLSQVLRSALAEAQYTLLYLNSFFSPAFTIQALLLRKLGLMASIPVILAPRGEFSPKALERKSWKKLPYIFVSRALELYPDVIWQASSTHEAENIRKCFGDQAKVFVAPNIAAGTSDMRSAQRPPKHPGELQVASIARVARHKNLDFALRSLERVPGEISFNIYGPIEDRQYWEECQAVMSRLPQNIRATYCGPLAHDKVFDTLSEHHLFFLPTRSENFGHVIVEALLAGCPVLISDQTPWRNLEQRRAGWDVPLDSQDLFERALCTAVEMDQGTFDQWSGGARKIGTTGLDANAVEKNRALLRMASGMPGLVEEASRAVG